MLRVARAAPPAGAGNQTVAQHIFTRNISAVAISLRFPFPVFLPDQLKCQMLVFLHLSLHFVKIGDRADFRVRLAGASRKQQLLQPVIVAIVRQGPTQTRGGGFLEITVNSGLAD